MERVKWLILYSRKQNHFHIENDKNRNYKLNKNGYTVVSVNNTEEECNNKLSMFIKAREENPEALKELCKIVDEIEIDVLALEYKLKSRV